MPTQQSFRNHTRFEPAFHFFLAPVLLLNFILAIYLTIRDWPAHPLLHLWQIVIAFAIFLLAGTMRRYAAQNQDRIIRLEERLRLTTLLPPADASLIQSLTTRQLIALRFASDAELPTLARRAAAENLQPTQIKQAITLWRPDTERI